MDTVANRLSKATFFILDLLIPFASQIRGGKPSSDIIALNMIALNGATKFQNFCGVYTTLLARRAPPRLSARHCQPGVDACRWPGDRDKLSCRRHFAGGASNDQA